MGEVALEQCFDAAKADIVAGKPDAAVAMCQHILTYYPQSVEAHRLLGEAHLDMEDKVAAKEQFELVLRADPENIIALCGLGVVHQEEKKVWEAVANFQSAYELSQMSLEIKSELRHLLTETTGRTRVELSRAGVARLYMRGQFYEQAVIEWQGLLGGEQERLDVLVGLAEAQWRSEDLIDAAETCGQILDHNEGCIKANVILRQIWAQEKHTGENVRVIERLNALDPDRRIIRSLFPDCWESFSRDLTDAIQVPVLPGFGAVQKMMAIPANVSVHKPVPVAATVRTAAPPAEAPYIAEAEHIAAVAVESFNQDAGATMDFSGSLSPELITLEEEPPVETKYFGGGMGPPSANPDMDSLTAPDELINAVAEAMPEWLRSVSQQDPIRSSQTEDLGEADASWFFEAAGDLLSEPAEPLANRAEGWGGAADLDDMIATHTRNRAEPFSSGELSDLDTAGINFAQDAGSAGLAEAETPLAQPTQEEAAMDDDNRKSHHRHTHDAAHHVSEAPIAAEPQQEPRAAYTGPERRSEADVTAAAPAYQPEPSTPEALDEAPEVRDFPTQPVTEAEVTTPEPQPEAILHRQWRTEERVSEAEVDAPEPEELYASPMLAPEEHPTSDVALTATIEALESVPTQSAPRTPEPAPQPEASLPEMVTSAPASEPLAAAPEVVRAALSAAQPEQQQSVIAKPQNPEIEALLTLIAQEPKNPRTRMTLANLYLEEDLVDQAVEQFQKALRTGTDQLTDVIQTLRKVITLHPEHLAARRCLGDALNKRGDYLQAMEQFNWLLARSKKK